MKKIIFQLFISIKGKTLPIARVYREYTGA
jgi:hypothetical protein